MESSCKCADPPGGTVTCPDGYIPICEVKNGKAYGSCLPKPSNVTSRPQLVRVIVTAVLDVDERHDYDRGKVVVNEDNTGLWSLGTHVVSFRLPAGRSERLDLPIVAGNARPQLRP
jgi:hypothetical protein